MKALFIVIMSALIFGCTAVPPSNKKINVRLTTYSRNERRADKWTRREQSATGIKLKDRAVLAADPKDIPFFSKVKLPCFDYLLSVIDSGAALKTRKASLAWGRNVPVLDLYFRQESDAIKFRKENPMFMDVIVYNNCVN